mmetsp:Transcript_72674/g.234936  ORF Transcript_72674/g.234936 Transcript_72674/m.234936 type:complete len:712 (-) Transcript_72674:96-2231(-)
MAACGKVLSRPVVPKGSPRGLSLSLEAPGRAWRVGEDCELEGRLWNDSGVPCVVPLGVHAGATDGGAALASVSLQVENVVRVPLVVAVSPGHYMNSAPECMFDNDDGTCWATSVGREGAGEFVLDHAQGFDVVLRRIEWRDFGDKAGVAEIRLEAECGGTWQLLSAWPCARSSSTQVHFLESSKLARRWRLSMIRSHAGSSGTCGEVALRGHGFAVRALRLFADDPLGRPGSTPSSSSSSSWLPARASQPRAVAGGPPVVLRQRAMYLPAHGSVSIPLRGRVVRAGPGPGAGAALSLGGAGTADGAEVLLPLLALGCGSGGGSSSTDALTNRYRLRLSLHFAVPSDSSDESAQDEGTQSYKRRELAWTWVGPHAAPRVMSSADFWEGSAVSVPVTVTVRPAAGKAPKVGQGTSMAQEEQRCSSLASPDAPPGTKQRSAGGPPTRPRVRRPLPFRRLLACAKAATATLALSDGRGDEGIEDGPGAGTPAAAGSRTSTASGRSGGSRCSSRDGGGASGQTPRLPRLSRSLGGSGGAAATGLEHGASWRGLSRHQDPLVDPGLLELAEFVHSFAARRARANNAGAGGAGGGPLVVLCGERLKSRTGQRFIASVRASGLRALPAPDGRALAKWAEAPRHVEAAGDLVLVSDWRVLAPTLAVLRRAKEDLGLASRLLGIVVLCGRHEEEEARAAVAASAPHASQGCPCAVLPSLAF